MFRKISALLVVCFFTKSVFAQMNYGVSAGANLSKFHVSAKGPVSKALVGFFISGYVDFGLSSSVSLRPGIDFQQMGGKIESYELVSAERSIHALKMPIHIMYHIPVGSGDNLLLGMGPFFGLQLKGEKKEIWKDMGTANGTISVPSGVFKSHISYSGPQATMNRLDYGISPLLGFKLQAGLFCRVSYDLGLAKLNAKPEDFQFDVEQEVYKEKSRVLSLGLGFEF